MRAGQLRHRITILTPSGEVRDSYGGVTPQWSELAKPWAEIIPVSARELEVARGYSPTVSHQIRIRYRTDINSRCTISYATRSFSINGVVDPDGRRRELLMYCTEIVS